MRTRPRRRIRRHQVRVEPVATFEIDLVDLMLDLDPGMLDRSWLDQLDR